MSEIADSGNNPWGFRPTPENRSLISKATKKHMRVAKRRGIKITARGVKSLLINEAIRLTYGPEFAGKREAGKR